MNPLTVRYFDVNRNRVATQLLDICLTSDSTADAIFTIINDTLKSYDIDWNMCVAFGVDNTNVNMGRRNSIRTRVEAENESVYFVGCPCHMVHNTACKASEVFGVATGFDVEDMLVDLYYWFDKSTKRKNELLDFCNFCNVEYRKVVKHVSTRWLSLEYAVDRALLQYPALKSYFLSSDEVQARFQRLKEHFERHITEIYLMFYQAIIPAFTALNKFLQRETPCVHLVHEKLEAFLRKILGKFIKVTALQGLDSVECIEYFVNRFPFLQDLTTPREMELLQEEFVSYQLLRDHDIPADIWDCARVGDDGNAYFCMDVVWGHLCTVKTIGSSELKYRHLGKVAKSVLVIPHSNASEERVFSLVRKNKTPFRPNLKLDGTLSSILTVKLGIDEPCVKFEPSKELIESAKKATWDYNKAHSH